MSFGGLRGENRVKPPSKAVFCYGRLFSAGAAPCTRGTFFPAIRSYARARKNDSAAELASIAIGSRKRCVAQTILARPDGPVIFSHPGWVASAGRRPDGSLFFQVSPPSARRGWGWSEIFCKSKTAVRQLLGRGEYRGFFNARARRVGGAVTFACAAVYSMVTGRMGEASASAGFSHLVTTWKPFDGRPGNLSPPSSRVEYGYGGVSECGSCGCTELRMFGYPLPTFNPQIECWEGAGTSGLFADVPRGLQPKCEGNILPRR